MGVRQRIFRYSRRPLLAGIGNPNRLLCSERMRDELAPANALM